MSSDSVSRAQRHFILQQGLEEPAAESCSTRYSALLFQPRLVAVTLLVAVVFQAPLLFLALAAVLLWSAIFPRWNPFDAMYNRFVATRPGRFPLSPAPAPRRFAQGMAGTFALGIGVSLLLGWGTAAVVLQVFLALAVAALTLGSFCLGSFLFHLLSGRPAFARRTLPWARGAARR